MQEQHIYPGCRPHSTRLTAIAFAVATLALGATAHAQEQAAAPAMQSVTVAGIRASMAESLNQKRRADSFVEVITSEDIGKMPDKNVADSLQRVAGVSVATAGGTEGGFGENDRVSLRATPSNMTLTTLNGHTVSSGDWFNQNINSGGRSVSYSLFPAEMIGQVVVHKSSQADLIEGGAAGTVDIETRKPLSFKQKLTAIGTAEAVYGTGAGKFDPQVSALVNWKNDSNTVGILAQAFEQKQSLRRFGQEFLWWDKVENIDSAALLAAHPDLRGKYLSLLTGSALFQQKRERQGGSLDVQVKVSQDFGFDISGFYSRMNARNSNANYMHAPVDTIGGGALPSAYTISGDTVTSITFPAVCSAQNCSKAVSSAQHIIARPSSYSDSGYVNLDWNYRASDALSFKGKFGKTEGTGFSPDIAYAANQAYSGSGYTLHGIDAPASIWVDNAKTYTPRTVEPVGGWAFETSATDKETYGQVDGSYVTPWTTLPNLRFGVRAADHNRIHEGRSGDVSDAGKTVANNPGGLTSYPSSPLSNVLDGPWTFAPDAVAAWGDKYVTYRKTYNGQFVISEKSKAAYLMGDLNFESVQGNVGVRYVRTDVEVANRSPEAVWDPVRTNNRYGNFLPSLNLRRELGPDLTLRASASRTLARPDIGTLGNIDLNDLTLNGSGGNPNLKPIMSNNFDLGLEWYFKPRSMVSVGLYKMQIGSYITFGSSREQFFNRRQNKITTYAMTSALNTKAEVQGLELQYIHDLGNGFGFNTNYSYADGKETGRAPTSACAEHNNCDMVGTSRNSANGGVFFENAKFSARINYSYRSTYLNGLDRRSAIYQGGVGNLSASLQYAITENLSLSFEGKNLNDPMLVSWSGSKDRPSAFYKNGRQFFLGLRAKM
ncbi:TonB-dependent receptor [Rugamonas aquatica]|uniref:TonB-dependent receptor n=1 Tax=Rugamonas aquatica TaxID=2743357 RepID=A0A6A7MWH4_9BURK|nr:TonB-dependent receptor [Rugamonas aquatica]MQA36688.1 TonB-dependent receptor [Rugamonas aquatica]